MDAECFWYCHPHTMHFNEMWLPVSSRYFHFLHCFCFVSMRQTLLASTHFFGWLSTKYPHIAGKRFLLMHGCIHFH